MMFDILKRRQKRETVTVYFRPRPDITAFELADLISRMTFCVPPGFGVQVAREVYDTMPEQHRRHWSLTPPPGLF